MVAEAWRKQECKGGSVGDARPGVLLVGGDVAVAYSSFPVSLKKQGSI